MKYIEESKGSVSSSITGNHSTRWQGKTDHKALRRTQVRLVSRFRHALKVRFELLAGDHVTGSTLPDASHPVSQASRRLSEVDATATGSEFIWDWKNE